MRFHSQTSSTELIFYYILYFVLSQSLDKNNIPYFKLETLHANNVPTISKHEFLGVSDQIPIGVLRVHRYILP